MSASRRIREWWSIQNTNKREINAHCAGSGQGESGSGRFDRSAADDGMWQRRRWYRRAGIGNGGVGRVGTGRGCSIVQWRVNVRCRRACWIAFGATSRGARTGCVIGPGGRISKRDRGGCGGLSHAGTGVRTCAGFDRCADSGTCSDACGSACASHRTVTGGRSGASAGSGARARTAPRTDACASTGDRSCARTGSRTRGRAEPGAGLQVARAHLPG